MAIDAGSHDPGNTLEGNSRFDGRAAEFHDDHATQLCISSALSTAAPAAPRMVLWLRATNFHPKTGQGRRRPTKVAMPRSRSASLRGWGRSASGIYCTGCLGALGRLRSCGTLENVSKAWRRSASLGLVENSTETVTVWPSITATRLQCALTLAARGSM